MSKSPVIRVVIKKGRHYPDLRTRLKIARYVATNGKLQATIRFQSLPDYTIHGQDRLDVSKIFGRTRGFFRSLIPSSVAKIFHKATRNIFETARSDSQRVGFSHPDHSLYIYWMYEKHKDFSFEEIYHMEFPYGEFNIIFPDIYGFPLGPYAGGNRPAPGDIIFDIQFTRIDCIPVGSSIFTR